MSTGHEVVLPVCDIAQQRRQCVGNGGRPTERERPDMELSDLVAALSRTGAYPHPVEDVRVRHTHISVVFLAGPYAYKVRKPVQLAFLDFSTLEKRRHDCDEEVRLNRRLAPSVYLGIVP